jgi:hypothetical protein
MRYLKSEKLERTSGILLTVLFIVSFTVVSAGAVSSDSSSQQTEIKSISPYQYEEPNLFFLQGVGPKYKDVQISYSTSSITGKPLLTYKDSKGARSFMGDEIRTQNTDMGTLVTVTLETVTDLRTVTLTLLVPAINLDGSAKEFKTIAIRTTNKTTIGGGSFVKGVVQFYEVIDLKGTANSVVF